MRTGLVVRSTLLAWIAWALALRADVWRREHVGHPKGYLVVNRPGWYPARRIRRDLRVLVCDVRRGTLDMQGHDLTIAAAVHIGGTVRLGSTTIPRPPQVWQNLGNSTVAFGGVVEQ